GRLFLQGVGERRYEFCGAYAVATVMFIARYLGATEVQLLKYANSGDVPFGNRSRVVGYSAIAFLKRSGSETVSKLKEDTVNIYRSLTEEEQKILLKIALEAIRT
ncbi:MAG TPA: AmmeMemoRadiSam system protein B, partial [Candidatus Omnitrophica bacterium]|nr:AmmeMemoRadiSam system protein B [Candidatus Omnitrophota bacterium]